MSLSPLHVHTDDEARAIWRARQMVFLPVLCALGGLIILWQAAGGP